MKASYASVSACGLAAGLLLAQQATAAVVYSNDFSGSVGSGWTSTEGTPLIATAPWGQRFLGRDSTYGFRWDTVTLSLSDLPDHDTVTLSFTLYIIRSWDGDNIAYGPDRWRLAVRDGQTILLLDTSFSNSGSYQSYPDWYPASPNHPLGTEAIAHDSLGYDWQNYYGDSTYLFTYTFAHSGSTLLIDFTGAMFTEPGNNWGIADESWGLDDVVVSLDLDEDGDGINDAFDQCPDTPTCATVDSLGCPSDGDGDGVFDGCDQCPGSSPGSWVNQSTGCPTSRADLDRDGDVDQTDFGIFQQCASGPGIPADPNCAD